MPADREENGGRGDAGQKRPESRGAWPCGPACLTEARVERAKASLRAKVEHPFLAVKRRFGYDKVRYRGLAKNRERLALLLGLTNLLRATSPNSPRPGVTFRPPRPSKRDGRANEAPALPRPPAEYNLLAALAHLLRGFLEVRMATSRSWSSRHAAPT